MIRQPGIPSKTENFRSTFSLNHNSELSIVIPTYNESQNLSLLLDKLRRVINGSVKYEVIIVDDNSPDGTGKLAEELSKESHNVIVVHRPQKMGLASAVIDGIKVAKADVIVVLDADLQHPVEILYNLLRECGNGADLVIASRYINGGSISIFTPYRKVVSKGARFLAHAFLPSTRRIKDPLSGYFMFKRHILKAVNLNGIGYKILLEILVKGKYKRIREIPYPIDSRRQGESKLKFKEYIDYMRLIFKLRKLESQQNCGYASASYKIHV